MTNMAVEIALKEREIDFVRANVGDRYVLEALQEKGWLLGGEGSGHLICLDNHYALNCLALQVLAALRRHKTTLPAFLNELALFPQTLVNVRVKPGFNWKENDAMQQEKTKGRKGTGREGPCIDPPIRNRTFNPGHGRNRKRKRCA